MGLFDVFGDIAETVLDPFDWFDTKGGGGDPASEAERLEQQRQRRLREAVRRIDALFDSPRRQKQYQDFVQALREYYTAEATRAREDQQRRLKFSLARTGQTGGSLDADARTQLGEEFAKGLLRSERQAQSALADLKSEDQESRLALIDLAASGLDVGNAASQAAMAMQSNLEKERKAGYADSLGDLFAGTASIWQRQKDAATRRRARSEYESLYGWGG